MESSYIISIDKSKLDVNMIHEFLSKRSYWAQGRTLQEVQKSIDNSICFGVYTQEGVQVAFARVATDKIIFAYLMDVFVLEEYRGQGVSKLLLKTILEDDDLKDLMRWQLDTNDAHTLYAQFGFTSPKFPERAMQRRKSS